VSSRPTTSRHRGEISLLGNTPVVKKDVDEEAYRRWISA